MPLPPFYRSPLLPPNIHLSPEGASTKKENHPFGWFSFLVEISGIEPLTS